jgi:UDP:flavonoid glycosyltransferase YjiC (YdhE family)
VIGDFRHSLSVSCRRRKIKYVNITNAYWSLEVMLAPPLPETPIIRVVGETLAKLLLKPLVPLGLRFSFFKMAFVIRKSLRGAGLFFSDYRQLLTDGDVTLYCDTPGLVPLNKQLDRERFIGPLVWSMPERLPDWWERLNPKKKRIFLTMGSSGPADSLPLIISSLSKLDVEVIVALAGRKLNLPSFSNVHITDYLPIKEACQNSDLVICNGGSPMSHAALAYGAPTIGIICNNDQLLNMAHIEKRGAGLMLRYWNLTEKKITASVNEILKNSKYAQNSQAIKVEFDSINVPERLQNVIEETMGNQL